MTEGIYFFELFTENYARRFKVDELYYKGRTKYQLVHCFYNSFLGKVLFLDKKIQSAQIDERIYHESLVHPALLTHPEPKDVLIIGGGEGATLREVLRHDTVRKATMVDIDRMLVEICRTHLPEWSAGGFEDPRTELVIEDARKFVFETKARYDVIISDLTEPVEKGPSIRLFTREFFEQIHKILRKDGLFVLQGGSVDPYYYHFFTSCAKTLSRSFSIIRPYWTFVLSFGLPWGFVLASKNRDPVSLDKRTVGARMQRRNVRDLQFFHAGTHKWLFTLPVYLREKMKDARVLTDRRPFIWEL